MPTIASIGPAVVQLITSRQDYAVPPTATVRYRQARRRGVQPRADIYVPSHVTEGARSVFVVHGGGFVLGHRRMPAVAVLVTHLMQRGCVVVSVDYRLAFRGGRLNEQQDDVVDALNWWVQERESWGAHADRCTVLGLSAGAMLAWNAAGIVGKQDSFIGIYGCLDLSLLPGGERSVPARLLTGSRDPREWRARSAVGSPGLDVPVLLVHGTADVLAPCEHSQRLAAARDELGLVTQLHLEPDAPHGYLQRGPEHGPSAKTLSRIGQFIESL